MFKSCSLVLVFFSGLLNALRLTKNQSCLLRRQLIAYHTLLRVASAGIRQTLQRLVFNRIEFMIIYVISFTLESCICGDLSVIPHWYNTYGGNDSIKVKLIYYIKIPGIIWLLYYGSLIVYPLV